MSVLDAISDPKMQKTVYSTDFDTEDIIQVIAYGEARYSVYKGEFCPWVHQHFKPTRKSLRQLWRLVRDEIEYKEDPTGDQYIKTPLVLAKLQQGDCKSKTLFVQWCLRCMGVPYKTRFASYNPKDPTIKHVYTIAELDGRELIIDAVWHQFNREKAYAFKQDYDLKMGELALIEGVGNAPHVNRHQVQSAQEAAYRKGLEEAQKAAEVIEQKKAYIPTFEGVPFNRLNEADAMLQLVQQELEILKVTQPHQKEAAQKALNMIHRAQKSAYAISGVVSSPFMERYAAIVQQAKQQQGWAANGHGLLGRAIAQREGRRPAPSVGNTGKRICLDFIWRERRPGSTDDFAPIPRRDGACRLNRNIYHALLGKGSNYGGGFMPQFPRPGGNLNAYANDLIFSFGSNTKYRKSFAEFGAHSWALLKRAEREGKISGESNGSWVFADPDPNGNFDNVMKLLSNGSGVLSDWFNEMMGVSMPTGSGKLPTVSGKLNTEVGAGLYYNFADKIPAAQGGFVSTNSLPPSLLAKKTPQLQWAASVSIFSGVSLVNTQQAIRNSLLRDSGGTQPERLLAAGYARWSDQPMVALDPATATIIAIISAIASALATVAKSVIEAESVAQDIDAGLAGSANFKPPTENMMPLAQDWERGASSGAGGGPGGGPGAGAGSNPNNKNGGSVLPWLIGGGLLYAVSRK